MCRHHLVRLLGVALLVAVAGPDRARSESIPNCGNSTTLLEGVNFADGLMIRGQYLSALVCYQSLEGTPGWDAADRGLRERFLFEYLQAHMKAAGKDRSGAPDHYAQAIAVADTYLSWCSQQGFSEDGCRRSKAVLFTKTLGEAHIRLAQWKDLCAIYEELASRRQGQFFFADTSLEYWSQCIEKGGCDSPSGLCALLKELAPLDGEVRTSVKVRQLSRRLGGSCS